MNGQWISRQLEHSKPGPTSSTFSGSPFTKSFNSAVPSVGIKDTLVFSGTISGTSLTGWLGSEISEYPVAHKIRPLADKLVKP